MRAHPAAAIAAPSSRPIANQNHRLPQRTVPKRPTRWRDIGVLVTVAPTLTLVTLLASYFFQ